MKYFGSKTLHHWSLYRLHEANSNYRWAKNTARRLLTKKWKNRISPLLHNNGKTWQWLPDDCVV